MKTLCDRAVASGSRKKARIICKEENDAYIDSKCHIKSCVYIAEGISIYEEVNDNDLIGLVAKLNLFSNGIGYGPCQKTILDNQKKITGLSSNSFYSSAEGLSNVEVGVKS